MLRGYEKRFIKTGSRLRARRFEDWRNLWADRQNRWLCKKSQGQGAQIPRREAYIKYAAATAGCSATQKLGFLQSHQTGIMTTGTVVHFSTRSATLPKLKCPSLPRLAITTTSIFSWAMILRISLAGSPTAMCRM